jgi:ribosomal protein S18 acetylase RimI-like enzyme
MPDIFYSTAQRISPEQLASVFDRSGINRPTGDLPRMAKMLEHGNLLATAWDGDKLVGVARSLTDFCYCCYLSDLAVDRAYQNSGIGRRLIALTQEAIGPDSMLLLLAAPSAMTYYPKVGFDSLANAFMIPRVNVIAPKPSLAA